MQSPISWTLFLYLFHFPRLWLMMMGNRERMINIFESKLFPSEAAGLEDNVLLQLTIFFYNKDCIFLKMQYSSCGPFSYLSINGRAVGADGKASYGQEGGKKNKIPLTRITEFHYLVKSLLLEPIWPLNPMYGIPVHSSRHRIHTNWRERNSWSNELLLKVMGIQPASYIYRSYT